MSKELDQLIEKFQTRRHLSDFILAILYQSGNKTIIKNRESLFTIFEQITKESKILALKNIQFDYNGIYPYSDQLDRAFSSLEIAGLLPYVIDANGSYYVLFDENHDKVKYDKFDDAEMKEIKEHALKFKALEKNEITNARTRK